MKLSISVLAVLALAGPALADGHAVRLGTEGAYPPYNFINDNGEVDGFERALGDELCARAGLECTWVTNDWDSIIPNLLSGNFDTIIAGMSITEERMEAIDFTQDYIPPDPSAYVALKGADTGVTGGVIATQAATIHASYVAASGATVVEYSTADETIAAVRNGEADAVLADYSFLVDVVADSGDALDFVGERVAIGGGVGIGVRKSDGELKGKLDAAISSMKDDGSLNALIAEWFDGKEGY